VIECVVIIRNSFNDIYALCRRLMAIQMISKKTKTYWTTHSGVGSIPLLNVLRGSNKPTTLKRPVIKSHTARNTSRRRGVDRMSFHTRYVAIICSRSTDCRGLQISSTLKTTWLYTIRLPITLLIPLMTPTATRACCTEATHQNSLHQARVFT
jgi:hypothetical protein